MLVPPFYDPLSFETLKVFLSDVAGAISLPIVYYNVPGATGIRLTADQIAELGEIDGIDYLKDTSGDAVTLTDLIVNRSDKIKAFNGWDTLTFFGIASGAEASVWGAAGVVPELAVELWETLAEKGDLVGAREIWRDLWAISDFLESVTLRDLDSGAETVEPGVLFVLIGSEPRTDWAAGALARDRWGFLLTGERLLEDDVAPRWPLERPPALLETSTPGVFAAGDVRAGSVKRVASAVGEGALAVTLVHAHLASLTRAHA